MSKPPPNAFASENAWMNEPDVAVPVTIVKTTSVNIASVVPVRNRLASGYAMEMRRSGASRRDRPEHRHDAAQQQVGVVHDRPHRADDDHQAGRRSTS